MEIKDLKVGDKVFVTSDYYKSIQTIEKITPKGNFRLSNGSLYSEFGIEKTSDYWHGSSFVPLTPELEKQLTEEITIKQVWKMMRDVKIENLDYKKALKIKEILELDL